MRSLIVFCAFATAYVSAFNSETLGKLLTLSRRELEVLSTQLKLHPDTRLNISQFLAKYGYPLESHDVTTEDGFILTLHRIPHGKNDVASISKPPVLFAHCLACSGMDWIWQGPNVSLPLLLADSGYDIWLANMRGTGPSMRHKTLTPADSAFWDYSFHEKGIYDMASSVDYILNFTESSKLTYVGHSQGTTAGLALTSLKLEYNDKINLMVMLSPIVYLEHMISPIIKVLSDYRSIITLVLDMLDIHGLEAASNVNRLAEVICNEDSPLQDLCIHVIGLFAGFDADQVDKSKLAVFLSNTPNGVSVKEVFHFVQEISSGAFRQYDFGNAASNLLHYGTSEPPSYNISEVTVPLAVYYAKNDFLASIVDVEKFLGELSRDPVDRYLIEYDYCNHLDFVSAKDIKTFLYDRVMGVIRKEVPVS
ncbi:lipase 3-like isoform X2 [Euwallacea fornicatus]|uniref:lipase 3-like isoform X2 n=1 Tax=Euwallacea fornicatus TaxID=995702 RepID=UPI00338FCA86